MSQVVLNHLGRNHFYEICDALSAHLNRYLDNGDPEMHEKAYGTLTLLNEAQCQIIKDALGMEADKMPWYQERLQKLHEIRVSQGLPVEPTQQERMLWSLAK